MATLTLFQPNANQIDTNYYENEKTDMTAYGWCQMTSTGIVYAELTGAGITYNSYDEPLLGTITTARSINETGNSNWLITGIGLAASDIYDVRSALQYSDAFYGNMVSRVLSGNDTVIGSSGNDNIIYSTGRDIIDGGLGNDTMDFSGYAYSDGNSYNSLIVNLSIGSYQVTSNANIVVTSTIRNVENVLGSDEDDRITGNTADNRLFGYDGSDTIYGGAGNDYINGGSNYWNDNDQLYGGDGNDFLIGSKDNTYIDGGTGSDTVSYFGQNRSVYVNLAANTGKHGNYNSYYNTWEHTDSLLNMENVIGTSWNDIILGNNGNNRITGGAGNDTLNGGTGIDTVDFSIGGYKAVTVNLNSGYSIGQGTDTLVNFEIVSGSSHNDIITGNALNNILFGNAGNDVINGWTGNDALVGGAGSDIFVFDTPLNSTINRDNITDFNAVADTIRLDKTIFTKLTTLGILDAGLGVFRSSATGVALDANDYILYNTTTGALLYDGNGSVAGGAVQFATLVNHPTITAADFQIVA